MNAVMNLNVSEIPVTAVSDTDFARVVAMVSNWERVVEYPPEETGFAQHGFARNSEFAVVSIRQHVTADVSERDGKAVARISRHADIEWVDVFSVDDPLGVRYVPARRMAEVA